MLSVLRKCPKSLSLPLRSILGHRFASKFVFEVSDDNFEKKVLSPDSPPTLVDFYANWCNPCVQLKPILEKRAEKGKGAFVLAKLNVDENQDAAMAHNVTALPTVKGFAKGKEVGSFVGLVRDEVIEKLIEDVITAAK